MFLLQSVCVSEVGTDMQTSPEIKAFLLKNCLFKKREVRLGCFLSSSQQCVFTAFMLGLFYIKCSAEKGENLKTPNPLFTWCSAQTPVVGGKSDKCKIFDISY